MSTGGFSLNPCTKVEDAVSCEKVQPATKRKARAARRGHPSKGCSSEGDGAAEKMQAVAGFSEEHKISKQKQEHEELACDIINKKDDGELLSAEEFDAFIAMMEEKHERLWAEYTPDGVQVMEYKRLLLISQG